MIKPRRYKVHTTNFDAVSWYEKFAAGSFRVITTVNNNIDTKSIIKLTSGPKYYIFLGISTVILALVAWSKPSSNFKTLLKLSIGSIWPSVCTWKGYLTFKIFDFVDKNSTAETFLYWRYVELLLYFFIV